jgi:hypothetical protein
MDEQNQGDELYPIAVLIDELKVRAPPSHRELTMATEWLIQCLARRCPPQTQCDQAAVDHRPRPGPRADKRRAHTLPRRCVMHVTPSSTWSTDG